VEVVELRKIKEKIWKLKELKEKEEELLKEMEEEITEKMIILALAALRASLRC
jgi:DNA-binding transcriptional regulator PaaX